MGFSRLGGFGGFGALFAAGLTALTPTAAHAGARGGKVRPRGHAPGSIAQLNRHTRAPHTHDRERARRLRQAERRAAKGNA